MWNPNKRLKIVETKLAKGFSLGIFVDRKLWQSLVVTGSDMLSMIIRGPCGWADDHGDFARSWLLQPYLRRTNSNSSIWDHPELSQYRSLIIVVPNSKFYILIIIRSHNQHILVKLQSSQEPRVRWSAFVVHSTNAVVPWMIGGNFLACMYVDIK